MKNSIKFIIVGIVCVVIGLAIGIHIGSPKVQMVGAISPTGSTNTTGKILSTVVSLANSSGTTTSIVNNSGFDYAETSEFAFCSNVGTSKTAYTGAGLASLQFRSATTSSAITGNVTDTNANIVNTLTVGTSTVDSYASSTLESIPTGTGRIIPNGTALTFSSNATNTASCVVGAHVIQL